MKKWVLTVCAGSFLFLVGFGIGYRSGTAVMERTTFKLAVRDAGLILGELERSSVRVAQVEAEVDRLLEREEAAAGEFTTLLSLQQPVDDTLFRGRRYKAFAPGTVDNLLRYYMGVVYLWDRLLHLRQLPSHLKPAGPAEQEEVAVRLKRELRSLKSHIDSMQGLEKPLIVQMKATASVPQK